MRVALVTVGDEILSGDTVNSNAAWLGRRLTRRGATVERVTVVPDRVADIGSVVATYHEEFDAVIVTGGLGPTHDDVTMEGVAGALDRDLVESAAVLEWLKAERGYAREDLAPGTADIPRGAQPIHNEVGIAPGCVVDSVFVLPGVPEEMEAMFEQIMGEFEGVSPYSTVVAVDEPESALVGRLEAVQEQFDVKIGSYPGDHVRLKLQSIDQDAVTAAAKWLRKRVELAEADQDRDINPSSEEN